MRDRLYLTHYRPGPDTCPLCYASVVWRKVGEHKWCPCDKNPVLCSFEEDGSHVVVKKNKMLDGVKIMSRWNATDFLSKKPFYALRPHVFSCTELNKIREF